MFLLGKVKLYAIAALAILSGVMLIYFQGVSKGVQKVKQKSQKKRIEDLLDAKEVSDEIQELDDDALYKRADKWLRKRDNK
jgi:uncharacterized membrane protein|tara:strand:- start:10202 stop:10444 length:243 start_codon:yes stop_codon:yes gene_type:complete